MASLVETDCLSNPNFAVICSFIDRYGETLGLPEIGYKDLQEWIEDTKKVNPSLIDLHVRLLRRIHKNVTADRWERGVVKFCYKYSNVDAWEIERFGYKLAKISTKLKLLKNLMESQFDCNNKFKDKINEMPAEDMRFHPVGRDKDGMAYWYLLDKELNLRVYREHQDDVDSESWELVCRNRDDLANLITGLETGTGMKLDKQESSDQSEPVSDLNEDSRDSFKQKTPLGPSPLTIKQEPVEGDSNDTKHQIVLKINKSDTQSPSKMLKDKFVKEKGSEIQRIMCKMKEEGLVSSESEDDSEVKDKSDKTDEVDGLVDSKGSCEKTLANNDNDDTSSCDNLVKDNVTDSKKDVKEVKLDKNGDEENLDEVVSTKGAVKVSGIKEEICDEDEGERKEGNKDISKKCLNAVKNKNEDIEAKHFDKTDMAILIKQTVNYTDYETNLLAKNNEQTKQESVFETSKACEEMDPEKSTIDCKKEKDEVNTPQNDSISKTEIKTESLYENTDKLNTFEGSKSNCTEDICDEEIENQSTATDQGNISNQNTAEIKGDENLSSVGADIAKETDKNELTNKKENNDGIDKDNAINTNEVLQKLVSKSNENSDNKEFIDSSVKCSTQTGKQNNEYSCRKPNQINIDETEVKATDGKAGSKTETKDEMTIENCFENPEKDTATENLNKDTKIEGPENDKETKVNEEDRENLNSKIECMSQDKECASNNTEKGIIESSSKGGEESNKDSVLKKTRKRKNEELKSECGSSSTEEEVDLESKQPCKRPVKAAVRKSPIKKSDESDVIYKNETHNVELSNVGEGNGNDMLESECDKDSDFLKHEIIKSKDSESKNKPDFTNVDNFSKKSENRNEFVTETEIKAEPNSLNESMYEKGENLENNVKCGKSANETEEKGKQTESEKNDTEIKEKAEEEAVIENENHVCDTSEKVKHKSDIVNEKDAGEQEKIVDQKSQDHSDKNTSELDEKNDSVNEEEKQTKRKVKGLVANTESKSKSKAQKRQAENSDDMEPVEPASKKSKLRGRVSSRGRGKRRGVNFDSSSSDDDLPLSQVVGRGRGSNSRGSRRKGVGRQQPKATKESPSKKKVERNEVKVSKQEMPELRTDLSEEDTGRRRSARVRNMRARKKSPSPDYVPSDLDLSDDEFLDDDYDDEEFKLKSKKRKKREPKEVVEEVPKGRNALRHEAKANKKGGKIKVEEEEEEAACVKCLRSHQPEWILLCDKCEAGYHTACLRPPLMIIPDGDWFCPPCEHTSLKEKLEENLKSLDQAILKNDRMVRRKERLAFVSVSLDNVLKEPEPGEHKKERTRKKTNYKESEDETESESSNETNSSSTTSESDNSSGEEATHCKKSTQKFLQRSCRSKKSVSYRFEEFDELIMDAIEEDLSIPKEPKPKKVKPPGISRGKDMSNILGLSDEEATKKPVRKRKPRLTELDEDIDDDDTDDYQLSDTSNVSDATKSSIYESDDISEESIDSSWRLNIRSTRKSRRKGGRNRKYKNDFVVDSDFESEEDSKRRSKRRPRKTKINYREINSDETEVEGNDDSFHSSELSDSDFEDKRRKRNDKKKKMAVKERPRSGKRQRIRKVSSSSESTEEDSDVSGPQKKKGKKPPSKTARYDSDDTDEGSEKVKSSKSKAKKKQQLSEISESETEENELTESSETEISGSDSNRNKKKSKAKSVQKVIKSDSEVEDGENNEREKKDDSQDTGKDSEESGWEEIGVDTDDIVVNSKGSVEKSEEKRDKIGKSKENIVGKTESEMSEKQEKVSEICIETQNSVDRTKIESNIERVERTDVMGDSEKDTGMAEFAQQKKIGYEKVEMESINKDGSSQEITPKKRGRKPKSKPEANETINDEIPVKKKRGRKPKTEKEAKVSENKEGHFDKVEAECGIAVEKKTADTSGILRNVPPKIDETETPEEPKVDDKNVTEIPQMIEKGKDDSPLSARNKQNAPVGIVKPEVRQGVIVENKQVTDGRMNESRAGENLVNPLQGMRDLAMGSQNMQGSHQSSFTPYTQSGYQNPNMPGYMGQQGFQSYQHQAPPYSQAGHGPHHAHPGGPPGLPQGPPQYPPNQGPMSPNSFQQHSSYMGPMQQGQSYYPGNYRPTGGHGEGLSQHHPHGSNTQFYHPHQGQRHVYPDYHGPYHTGPQGNVSMQPNQQCPGPYPGMPYNYPNMPHQGLHRPEFSPPGPQQNMSPNQVRPQTRLPGPHIQQSSPPRVESDAPNRGFMMDNILKPSSEGTSNDVEDSAEVSDIDRYTSFLCKSTD